jgi:hypothetical protein
MTRNITSSTPYNGHQMEQSHTIKLWPNNKDDKQEKRQPTLHKKVGKSHFSLSIG